MSKKYDNRHGGPFDRGSADSYYRRGQSPHYYKAGTATSEKVEAKDMTEDELEAYLAGYAENELFADFKEYY